MRTRPIVALIAASLMAVSLAACGSDKPTTEPTAASNATSPSEGAEQTAYFEGLPRFTFSAELDCASLESLDLTPLGQRMSPGEPLGFGPHGNIAGEADCNWATEMSDSFEFRTGQVDSIIGLPQQQSNLSTCYAAQSPATQIDTEGQFTAAWAQISDGLCTGNAMYAVALSEDEQSAATCIYRFKQRNTDMGEDPITDIRNDPEARKIFIQLCSEAFASIKS